MGSKIYLDTLKSMLKVDILSKKVSLFFSALVTAVIWFFLSYFPLIPARKITVYKLSSYSDVATETKLSFYSVLYNGLRWKDSSGMMIPEVSHYTYIVNIFWVVVFILLLIPIFLIIRYAFYHSWDRKYRGKDSEFISMLKRQKMPIVFLTWITLWILPLIPVKCDSNLFLQPFFFLYFDSSPSIYILFLSIIPMYIICEYFLGNFKILEKHGMEYSAIFSFIIWFYIFFIPPILGVLNITEDISYSPYSKIYSEARADTLPWTCGDAFYASFNHWVFFMIAFIVIPIYILTSYLISRKQRSLKNPHSECRNK